MRSEKRFRPDLEAPCQARAFVADAIGAQVAQSSLETASLLVSELVTNAVLHTDTPVEVAVDLEGGRLAVSVKDGDASTAPAVVPHPAPIASEAGGRGLKIVDSLADQWGVDTQADGKRVWFELGVEDRSAAESMRETS